MEVRHEHGGVGRAEFREDLATRSARGDGVNGIGDNSDSGDGSCAFGDGFEDGGPFRAVGKAERGIFDICAGENQTVGKNRGTDVKPRVGGVRTVSCGDGVGQEVGDAGGLIHAAQDFSGVTFSDAMGDRVTVFAGNFRGAGELFRTMLQRAFCARFLEFEVVERWQSFLRDILFRRRCWCRLG